MEHAEVLDVDGQQVGIFKNKVDTPDGEMLLVARGDRFGGGTIVVPARQADQIDDTWRLSYDELSIREAPPYSMNVGFHAYFEFWERLGAGNYNSSVAEYMPTGSGLVKSDVDVPDDRIQEEVTDALREVADGSVDYHLVRVSVKNGTVLLEGYQNDTPGRLAAAEATASVPGVKEIVNMLVIRAL